MPICGIMADSRTGIRAVPLTILSRIRRFYKRFIGLLQVIYCCNSTLQLVTFSVNISTFRWSIQARCILQCLQSLWFITPCLKNCAKLFLSELRQMKTRENECTSHNFSLFAIFLPKVIKIGGNLTKFWQKQFSTVFLKHGV